MATLEDVIDRIKTEGQLTRNSGTNSLKVIASELKSMNNNQIKFFDFMRDYIIQQGQLGALANPPTPPGPATPAAPQTPTPTQPTNQFTLAGAALALGLGLAAAVSSFFDEIVSAIRIPTALRIAGDFVSDINRLISRIGRGLFNTFASIRRAVTVVQNGISRIGTFLRDLGGFLTKSAVSISTYFKNLFNPKTGTVGSFFTKVNNLLKPVVAFMGTVFKSISAFVKNLAVFNVFREMGTVIGSVGQSLKSLSGGASIFKRIADFIKQLSFVQRIVGVLGTALRFLRFALGPISMVIFTFVDFIKGFIKGFGEGGLLSGIKEGLLEVVRGLVTKPLDLLKDLVSWAAGKLGFSEFEGMLDSFSFTDMFNQFITSLEDIFEDVGKWFSTLFSDPVAAIEQAAAAYLEIYRDFGLFIYDNALKPAGDFLGGLFDGVVETFKENFSAVGDWFSGIADRIMVAAEEIWVNAIAAVKRNFLSLFDYLATLPDKILIGAQQLAIDILGGTRIGRGVLSSIGISQESVDSQRAELADLQTRRQAASLATMAEGGVGAGKSSGANIVAPTTVGPTYTGTVYNGPVTVNNDSSSTFGLNPNDKTQMAYGF